MTIVFLFDWDGTVVDSHEALISSYRKATLEVLGRTFPSTDEETAKAYMLTGEQIFTELSECPDQSEELAEAYNRHYLSMTTSKPFPGVVDFLQMLRASNVRLGVVTSKSKKRLNHDMQVMPELALFDASVCADDVTHFKPAAEPVIVGLEKLRGHHDRAVMIGDTIVDIRSGQAAGVDVIAAGWGFGDNNELASFGVPVAASPDEILKLLPGGAAAWGLTDK